MEQFLSYLIFDSVGLVCLLVLFVTFIVQVFFYLFYYRKPLLHLKNTDDDARVSSEQPSVSVIIVAEDDTDSLDKILPAILNQNYPDYEVIVVNDGSGEENELILKNLKKEYSHLYSTFSPISYENKSRRQKVLSLTIGIKAATKDILLFSSADSTPIDSNWISSMTGNLTPDKDIVLGYCRYDSADDGIWGKLPLFDNLLFSLQYFSMAIENKPFTGVYRNVAYRKSLFFENKGFSSSLKYDNAEEIFLNTIMNETNTTVSLSQSSFVSCELKSFSMWKLIKKNYLKTKKHFQNFTPKFFHLETSTRYLFYILFIITVAYSSITFLWVYLLTSMLMFISRYFIQYSVLSRASKHFGGNIPFLLLPMMDLIQPYYNSFLMNLSKIRIRKKK